MLKMNALYEETFKICTWDVDASDQISLASCFNFCQEVAGIHATELGVGTDYMRENGILWVLSRMSCQLTRRPGWGKHIQVRTWPYGTDRLFALRDYEMSDDAGTFLSARSAWLIVDIEKKRPRRPEALAEKLPRHNQGVLLENSVQSVAAHADPQHRGTRTAAYSDIDCNAHVNNARYIQWIQDCLDPSLLCKHSALRIDINYLGEVQPSSNIDLFYGEEELKTGRNIIIEGRQAESGAPSFRSSILLP